MAVDATHVNIMAQSRDNTLYINRKRLSSLNVMVVRLFQN